MAVQSRTAARKELLDQATAPDECEKLYEESLWCLYTLQDDLLQTDNPFADEDRTTISTCAPSFHDYPRRMTTNERSDCCRDQAHKAKTVALPGANEATGSRTVARCPCRPELGRCATVPPTVGG
jgi:hypothetical protein